jgi:hypothetical protein
MKLQWVVVCCLASLIVGVGCATWFWQNFYTMFIAAGFEASTTAGIVTKVAVLERLRAGHNVDAVELLETQLDGDILSAGELLKEGHALSKNVARALAQERAARAVSTHAPPGQTVRDAVQSVFESLPTSGY